MACINDQVIHTAIQKRHNWRLSTHTIPIPIEQSYSFPSVACAVFKNAFIQTYFPVCFSCLPLHRRESLLSCCFVCSNHSHIFVKQTLPQLVLSAGLVDHLQKLKDRSLGGDFPFSDAIAPRIEGQISNEPPAYSLKQGFQFDLNCLGGSKKAFCEAEYSRHLISSALFPLRQALCPTQPSRMTENLNLDARRSPFLSATHFHCP